MKLNDAARELIGAGTDAMLVTLNPDGSPQVSTIWMALESTPEGDELVSAHLSEYRRLATYAAIHAWPSRSWAPSGPANCGTI